MSNLSERLAGLSPEKRKLLELRMKVAQTQGTRSTLVPRPRPDGTAPLSFAQQRLWVLDQMNPGSAVYNIPHPLKIVGPLAVDALRSALNALCVRHETLRTVFAEGDGEPMQVILPPYDFPLEVEDLAGMEEGEREREALRRIRENANAGFDLRRGPLLRVRLVRMAPEEHLLLICMHHIVTDGWSLGVLARELGKMYAAELDGSGDPLPALPIQYADFAVWQREHLTGDTLERDLAFWRRALGGAPVALELPTDRPRPPLPSHVGENTQVRIAPALAGRLRDFARAEGTTLFTVLLAAFRVVLMRHSGQDEVVVGTPVANRTRREVEGLIGFFVNTLALRTDASGDPTFREMVRREHDSTLEAFSHQDLPFERVVEALKIPRDGSRNPVFQAMMTLQNADMEPLRLAGVKIFPVETELEGAKFDVTFDIYDGSTDGSLVVLADWAVELFDRPSMERMVSHFTRLLERAVAAPHLRRSELDMMDAAEREQVVSVPNRTATGYPRDASVHGLFAEHAAAAPDAEALVFGDRRWTYGEVEARANQLAHHLRALGVGPEDRVGVAMERSDEMLVAHLGILKAGGAYLPLDPSYPPERLAFMAEDSGARVAVVADEAPEALAEFGGTVVSLARDGAHLDTLPTDAPRDVVSDARALACVLYTSGSTGRPKGTGLPHRALVRLVRDTNYARLTSADRTAHASNTAFDVALFEIWGGLLNGGAVVVLDRETSLNPHALAAAYRREGVTAAFVATALFNHIVREAPDAFATLTHVIVGGQAMDPYSTRRVLEAGPPRHLVNGYGPTESACFATTWEVSEVAPGAVSIPIGHPIANTTAYVLEPSMRPAAVGVRGELFLGGDGLARGYLARPALTAERFVPDPFGEGTRLYRTGDAVRWREDGTLEYMGRLDEQVKIRGFRVEPGEVEAALLALPGVGAAVVVAREDVPGDRRLVGYVTPRGDAILDPAVLRDALGRGLPEYMVPAALVVLDALPLTPNGKIDRRALPAPEWEGDSYVAPRTGTEEVLARVFGEVLRVERVGIDDDFFVLGGHSLLAAQAVSRLGRAFGVDLPLRTLFEASTARSLGERVDELLAAAAPREAETELAPIPRGGELPLSFAQERMWFLDRLEPGAGAYNMPIPFTVHGPLEVEALRRALEDVVGRHEALRSRFEERDGRPVQTVAQPEPFPLPLVETDRDEARRAVLAEMWRPFDLAAGPLVRATVFRVAEDEHVVLINLHHITADGWSLGLVFNDLSARYAAHAAGEAGAPEPLALQYADFAAWQRRWLAGDRLQREVDFWRRALDGAPSLLALPTDRPRPPAQSYRGAVEGFVIPAATADQVRELAQKEGATLFMVFLAAFQALLGRLAGEDDVVVGTPLAGREHEATESIVGLFVNTLALRADLAGDPDFLTLLRRVREGALDAFAHPSLPFERLVDELKTERSLGHAPVFQVMFALQNTPSGSLELGGARVGGFEGGHGIAKFDLTLNLEEAADGVRGWLEYATDLFDASTARRINDYFARMVAEIAADPRRRLSAIPLADDAERSAVLEWGSGATRPYPQEPVHAAVAAQVARSPRAVAVTDGTTELTYEEIDARANRLAHALLARGVARGTRVAVVMERSTDLPVALLGVLRAGAAYVPVDPSYPAERVRWVLEDSRAPLVITRSGLRASLPRTGAAVLTIDEDAWLGESAEDPGVMVDGDDVAYLIYTSGSTGRPKGAAIPHRALANHMRWMAEEFPLAADDRVLQKTPVAFDASVWEFWAPLMAGATLVMASPEAHRDPGVLARECEAGGITTLQLVPALLRAALDEADFGRCASLRRLFVGGEAFPAELARRAAAAIPGLEVVNLYGPTETTIDATAHRFRADDEGHTVPLGRPIANARARVLDPWGEPAPLGAGGELYLGGALLGAGYEGKPGETAARWLPDPFAGEPGARMYRTGDRARWRADGTLEYLGRTDFQVKIRGVRIEPGEVEAVLAALPGVRAAAVAAREDAGPMRLVAYVVTEPGTRTPALRALLAERIPDAMVPSAWVEIEALPLTPGGKIDRRALPAPEAATDDFTAPATPDEEMLAGIWATLLGVERVGITDDFFALGGHSLLATQLASRVRAAFGVELPLRAVFEAPTVHALAMRIAVARGEAEGVPAGPIPRAGRDGDLPLSFAQERLWFLAELEPDSPVYNVPMALDLAGPLDTSALERALAEVVRRHESLRTVFIPGDRGPGQRVLPPESVPISVVDLAHYSEAERGRETERRVTEAARQPFDLRNGPVVRASVLRLAPEEHVLIVAMHHVASDAWSTGVLFRELTALYAAYAAGGESPLAPLPIQYADYAVWQRGWLQGETLERQLGYWRERLAGAPTLLDLPTDHPRPAAQDVRGASYDWEIPASTVRSARELARSEGATLFMALIAAAGAVLGRWSGQDDVVLGSPIANRTRAETEGLIGFFVNTLALRVEMGGDPSFRELLRRVRETTLGAYAHQDVPFERLVEELGAERSLAHTPLFQAMVFVQNTPGGELDLGGTQIRARDPELGTSRFDLTFGFVEAGDEVAAMVEYACSLFDRDTVARMTGHIGALLAAAAADPDAPVSSLPILGEGERHRVVTEWNVASVSHPATTAPELFAAQAARTPHATALEFHGEHFTYAELDARASRLARYLVGLGVGPDRRVVVALERSAEMVIAVLATLKAGGCYVAVDPGYPAERVRTTIEDSGALVLLTTAALAGRFPAGPRIVRLDEDAEEIAALSGDPFQAAVHPASLAYVLYTSGSTGRPKGVALPHAALANLLAWQIARWGAGSAARTLQFASLSFDVSFQELFATWCAGGTLVLVDDDTRRDAEALLRYLRAERIERLFLPFAALQNLAETAEGTDARLPDLREIVTAGEQLHATPQLRAFFHANLHCRLENQYGPTETHVVSALALDGDSESWPLLPTIGTPISGTALYVLDGRMEPAPVGVPGELFAGGAALARGYLGRPDLTADRFVPDPFGSGGRLYRTGDRARWRPDGTLEYLGRVDFQVKIRGFRVEPGEVEATLAEHPAVLHAAVTVRGEGAAKRLAAYVVPVGGAAPVTAELRAWVAERLPDYMVPAAWTVLEAMPLTPSGKIDRRALPEPAAATEASGHVAPRTPAEEVVAGIWEEVLGTRPGMEDDFFTVGGHSLRATQVVARIREAFGIELPLRALFEAPTVAGLAARAASARSGEGNRLPPLVPARRDRPIPLSFAQQRFWFVEQLGAAGPAYNIPVVLRLAGELDAAAMRRALNALVDRHEALRTRFHLRNGDAVQEVMASLNLELPLHDLSGLAEAEREAEAARISDAEARTVFDLKVGPLIRAQLVRLGADEHLLLVTLHHIVGDAWSLDVLYRELGALYAAERDGTDAGLPALPVQYPDYAVWQRERLDGPALERELAFWRARLEGAATLVLPTDRPHPPVQSFRGAMNSFSLPAATVAAVAELSRRGGATPFMAYLAAFKALLHRYTGMSDVVVGSPVAGRVPAQTEPLIGVFVNTLALRTDLGGDPTFRELLGRVREGTLDAYAHQEVPFERLVEELRIERSLSRHPLFQVIFSMHAASAGGGVPELAGVRVAAAEGDTGTAKTDLVLAMSEGPHGISAGFQYAVDLFDAETIDRMAEHFVTLLDSALADPDRRISELPLSPPAELEAMAEWNRNGRDYPAGMAIHHLFEAQAERTPNAVAVTWKGESVTYAELNRRANLLAHHLRGLGVGPETRVAVSMRRNPDLIVALYAILKAGGAYVPIDPNYPTERIGYMLADCGAAVLLADSGAAGRLPAHAGATVLVDAEWDTIAAGPDTNPGVAVQPETLAYAIYTSGSTGRPKGVAIEHRSTVALLHWLRENVSDDERSGVLAATSISFDVTIVEVFGTLSWGGRIVLVENALSLGELTADDGVTLVSMAPTAAAELLRTGGFPTSVRVMNIGGEALPPALAEGLVALPHMERVVNFYGPTEDTSYSTGWRVRPGAERMLVGRPISNSRAHVLDFNLRPAPRGIPGELYLAGAGLARGYLGRPGLTAERFLPDPFATEPGARMYRVGDLVRFREEGEIDYLGRLDHQIKIRGHRVEMGEIETALMEHPGVREAVVAAREDVPGDVRLAAYVVGVEGRATPDAAELRAYLREHLPDFMIPSAFVAMERLPLLPNDKVDRKNLPAPADVESARPPRAEARSATERTIAAVWAEVLALPRVEVDDNFFEVGGHSLLLARMQEKLTAALGRPVSVLDLFQYPTVAALAAHLDPRPGEAEAPDEAPKVGQERGSNRRSMMQRRR